MDDPAYGAFGLRGGDRPCLIVRSMFRGILLFSLLFLTLLSSAGAADSNQVHVALPPDWIRVRPEPDYTTAVREEGRRGVYYLLVDRQTHAEKQETYSHLIYKITSTAGLQDASQISLSFDPNYQSIDLHALKIWREGKSENRLLLEKMQILQQERDLERFQYNGQLTALFLLEDVRVGDVVEYAYTRKGQNPIFGPHYVDTSLTNWGSPIREQSLRLLCAKTRHLVHQQLGGSPMTLEVHQEGDLVAYEWTAKNQKAAEFEAGAPSWFLPLSLVQISDFENWKDVVNWALPLYARTPLSEPLRAKAHELVAGLHSNKERAVAILDFVQRDIRYLGMELGPRSHAPTEPDRVFRLRYGDCKDKVRLFCAMLDEVGISAVPALTHSARGKKLNNWLPSIDAFDHVIARVDLTPLSYWVDPTLTDQAGTLDRHALPEYGWALPIEQGSAALQRVHTTPESFSSTTPSASKPTTLEEFDPMKISLLDTPSYSAQTEMRVNETFVIGEPGAAAELHVKSIYTGLAADGMRSYLRETPPSEVGKHLLNFRAKVYPNLKLLGDPQWKDDRRRNEITLEHNYHVPELWRKEEGTPVLRAEFYPFAVRDYVAAPETMVRTSPYAVPSSTRIVCEIDLELKNPWPLKNENRTISDPAFEGSYSLNGSGKKVSLRYEYRTLNDAVEASRMEEFATHLHEFRDTFGYTLTFNPEIAKRNASFRLNWQFLALGTASLVGWIVLACWIYRRPWGLHPISREVPPSRLVGLKGWLILVGLGLFWRVIGQTGIAVRVHGKFLDLRLWEPLTPNLRTAISIELVGQLGLFVLSVLCAITFVRCRRNFPVFFVASFVALLAFEIIDGTVVANFYGLQSAQAGKAFSAIVPIIVAGCVWVPYMFVSRRVQATFTVCRENIITPVEPPPLVALKS